MCADFLHLGDDLAAMEAGGVGWWHIDIMDGHFVPNLTLGPDYCRAIASASELPLDIHMMLEPVEQHIDLFLEFKGSYLSFHPEAARHPMAVIQKIQQAGCKAGIAISPATTVATVDMLLPLVDYVCIMTVNPGFAGQAVIPSCIDKIREVRTRLDEVNPGARVEVDGNVSWVNIPKMLDAGADVLVCGTSSIFGKDASRADNLQRLREMVAEKR